MRRLPMAWRPMATRPTTPTCAAASIRAAGSCRRRSRRRNLRAAAAMTSCAPSRSATTSERGSFSRSASASSTPSATAPTRFRPHSGRPRRRPPCCGSIQLKSATHSRSRPSRPQACPIGSATASMWRKPSISAAWARVTAATMIASGFTGVDDFLSGTKNLFTAVGGEKPQPEELVADLGKRYEIMNTSIKKWTVGSPLQSVLDAVTALLEEPAVRAGQIKRIVVDMPADRLHIVDNRTIPDICLQHLVAMMIVDGGATFASIHDAARMSDPKVLAVRRLVEAVPNQELVTAVPARQSIVTIETTDGRTLSHRTYEVRGTPGNPMNADEVAAKALDLMAPVLGDGRAKELIAAIYGLDTFGGVAGLRPLLQA